MFKEKEKGLSLKIRNLRVRVVRASFVDVKPCCVYVYITRFILK